MGVSQWARPAHAQLTFNNVCNISPKGPYSNSADYCPQSKASLFSRCFFYQDSFSSAQPLWLLLLWALDPTVPSLSPYLLLRPTYPLLGCLMFLFDQRGLFSLYVWLYGQTFSPLGDLGLWEPQVRPFIFSLKVYIWISSVCICASWRGGWW